MMKCTLCQGSNILGLRQQLQVEESSRQSEISKVQLESALKSRNTPQRDRTSPLPFTLLEEKKNEQNISEGLRVPVSTFHFFCPLQLSSLSERLFIPLFCAPLFLLCLSHSLFNCSLHRCLRE